MEPVLAHQPLSRIQRNKVPGIDLTAWDSDPLSFYEGSSRGSYPWSQA
jgi:hypothetical protein